LVTVVGWYEILCFEVDAILNLQSFAGLCKCVAEEISREQKSW
jgi:hypothetical protein